MTAPNGCANGSAIEKSRRSGSPESSPAPNDQDLAGSAVLDLNGGTNWNPFFEERLELCAPFKRFGIGNENVALFASVVERGSRHLIDQFVNAGAPALAISNSIFGKRSALENAAA